MSGTQEELKVGLIEAFAKARQNLVYFRKILLVTGKDEVEAARFHFDWSDILLNVHDHFAIEGFRESAKGQFVLRAFPLYSLAFPDPSRDYIVIIKNNETEAEKKLLAIEEEYLSNPAISSNLVGVKQKSARIFSVDVKNEDGETINILIEAYGKGSSVRGLVTRDRRPKIAIIDDPQDLEDSKSPTVLENDWDWFLSDVKFLGQYTRIFLIGNNLGEGCIIERVIRDKDSWGFKAMVVPVLDSKDQPTWPAKYPLKQIMEEREAFRKAGKIEIWLREKMCEAVSLETRVFDPADYRYVAQSTIESMERSCNAYGCLDPAASLEKSACYRAIEVVMVNSDNHWFVPEVRFGRWDSVEMIETIFDVVLRWKLKYFGIEKGALKDVLLPLLNREMQRRNCFFTIVPVEHAKRGSKLERIKALQPRFRQNLIWFLDGASWLAEMETELAGVTKDQIKSLYIDLVDCLAMFEQFAKPPLKPVTGALEFAVADSRYSPLKGG